MFLWLTFYRFTGILITSSVSRPCWSALLFVSFRFHADSNAHRNLYCSFLSELAPRKVKMLYKARFEMLAAIPSVVIGFWVSLLLVRQYIPVFGLHNGLNALNGSVFTGSHGPAHHYYHREDAIHAQYSVLKKFIGTGCQKWQTLFIQ